MAAVAKSQNVVVVGATGLLLEREAVKTLEIGHVFCTFSKKYRTFRELPKQLHQNQYGKMTNMLKDANEVFQDILFYDTTRLFDNILLNFWVQIYQEMCNL